MSDDLVVSDDLIIPEHELTWRFDTSGGPGGQHANKSATRVELSYDLGASRAVDSARRERMLARLGGKAAGGIVTVVAADSRSQWRNRQMARRRMSEVLSQAMRVEAARRRTAVPRSAERRRLKAKRHRAAVKRMRRSPEQDE